MFLSHVICARCCVATGPGQRERIDPSLVPRHIHVIPSGGGGGQRMSAAGPRGAGPRGAPSRGHGMPQPMIPTAINQHAQPGTAMTRSPVHIQAPTGNYRPISFAACCTSSSSSSYSFIE